MKNRRRDVFQDIADLHPVFEKSIEHWKKLEMEKINEAAAGILLENTVALKKGETVEKFIKK